MLVLYLTRILIVSASYCKTISLMTKHQRKCQILDGINSFGDENFQGKCRFFIIGVKAFSFNRNFSNKLKSIAIFIPIRRNYETNFCKKYKKFYLKFSNTKF